MPWKEYLRRKMEEERRSVEFKRQADGTQLNASSHIAQ
jgi:hypothetical protein